MKDAKLAHSIADEVEADAQAIAELSKAESQAEENRQVAIRTSHDDPDLEAPPPCTEHSRHQAPIEGELISRLATLLSSSTNEEFDESTVTAVAGPSKPYARRQADALYKLVGEHFQCIACTEKFRWADVKQLHCEHQYCGPCLKRFITRGVVDHDLTLIPPRCCGEPVPSSTIVNTLTEEEMEGFQNAEIEKNTRDKT